MGKKLLMAAVRIPSTRSYQIWLPFVLELVSLERKLEGSCTYVVIHVCGSKKKYSRIIGVFLFVDWCTIGSG